MPKTSATDTGDEKRRAMPGDHLVPEAMATVTNGITIKTTPELVWPWIAQIGSGRAGWYSYDWIDNGGHPSARSILPQYQQLDPGDIVPAIPGMKEAFCVAMVEPPRNLVLTVPEAKGGNQVSYAFLVLPLGDDQTRLIVRGRISRSWPTATQALPAPSQPPIFIERVYDILGHTPRPVKLGMTFLGHYVMESRMLRGIKRRAEGSG